jgi:hypothetical protein
VSTAWAVGVILSISFGTQAPPKIRVQLPVAAMTEPSYLRPRQVETFSPPQPTSDPSATMRRIHRGR